MGEEEKKTEETKAEEVKQAAEEPKKPEEEKTEKKEEETKAAEPPPPPPEIVLKVFMHCEGCARKVRRSLKGFPGVEDVITDCKSQKVVVKGDKADPLKVLERVQRKSHRQVELLSPIPKPPEEKKIPEEEAKPEPEKKKEEPQIVTVVLKVHMHCEACAQEMKRRIQRMKGVESVEPDLKNSQVIVKGVYDPAMLVTYVYKRCGKQSVIVKQESAEEAKQEKKAEEEGEKDEKKSEGEENNKEKKDEKGDGKAAGEKEEAAVATVEETVVAEVKKNEYYYYPAESYGMNLDAYPAYQYQYDHAYPPPPPPPPQIFSDENPNACNVM